VHRFTLEPEGIDRLIGTLSEAGYQVVGPVASSGAIRYAPVNGTADLPVGLHDRQEPGAYHLEDRGDGALFGYVVGPTSLKDILFPPRRPLWTAIRQNGSVRFEPVDADPPPTAVIGVRACELAAAGIQDRVFRSTEHRDLDYTARRAGLFIVAVNCTEPASTCFCVSMGTGPGVSTGFDLSLTEVIDGDRHILVGEVGSDAGVAILEKVEHEIATTEDLADARYRVAAASGAMARSLQTEGLRDLLAANPLSGRWYTTAERCLACGNCTQVCPTCFCTSTEDSTTLDGGVATRERRWDSCFSLDFSLMGGRPVRSTIGARYRQWLTHKLSTWVDQFGVFGCVGCGRCITWCPVGIDLTEEIAAIRATEATYV
jgi:ferredoxin